MDWHPNEDAVLYFVDTILPIDPREDSTTRRSPSSGATPLNGSARRPSALGMIVTGTVDDVRPWMDEGAVYVVPLRAGGGTRLKIFEALAMAKAVVSTTVGAEGLALTPGREFIAADDPQTFAQAVVALLRTKPAIAAVARPGRTPPRRRAVFLGAGRARVRSAVRRRSRRAQSSAFLQRGRMNQLPSVVLICHEGDRLDTEGLASWLASTMNLARAHRDSGSTRRVCGASRVAKSAASGWLGFVDVVAFRAVSGGSALARSEEAWKAQELSRLRARYPADLTSVPRIVVSDPNSDEARDFLDSAAAGPRHRALQVHSEAGDLLDRAGRQPSRCTRASVPSTATRMAVSGRWRTAISSASA